MKPVGAVCFHHVPSASANIITAKLWLGMWPFEQELFIIAVNHLHETLNQLRESHCNGIHILFILCENAEMIEKLISDISWDKRSLDQFMFWNIKRPQNFTFASPLPPALISSLRKWFASVLSLLLLSESTTLCLFLLVSASELTDAKICSKSVCL